MKKILLVALVSSLMVGCGGSDSDSNTTTNPTPNTPDTGAPEVNPKPDSEDINLQGIYDGTTAQGQEVLGVVTDSNELWFLYSDPYRNGIDGFINGKISQSKNNFTAKAKDYNISTNSTYPATISSDFTTDKNISGTLDYGRLDTVGFNLDHNASASKVSLSTMDLGLKAYKGSVGITGVGVENASITIEMDGKIIGTGASGCKINGNVSNTKARNYLDVKIQFGSSPCALTNTTFNGVAYYNAEDKSLMVTSTDSKNNYGLVFVGEVVVDGVGGFMDLIDKDIQGSELAKELSKPIEKIS